MKHTLPKVNQEAWHVRIGLVAVIKGLFMTLRHIFRPKVTIQYPEEQKALLPGTKLRGQHRLNSDDQGRPKCVACLLCQTACPSHCIEITPGPAPKEWTDRDRYPLEFKIDMLRCIYCGMCEEACPCDAIVLTDKPYAVTYTREGMIYNKERLLKN